jgi:methyl-accepting chemotaxis protein
MLKNFSIKKLLLGVSFTIIIVSSLHIFMSYNELDKIENKVLEKDHEILPHVFNFLRLQKDVIQVQQWLTDISATRAHEGFDDGFTEADIYFKDGNKVLDHLIKEHQKYNEPQMVQDLQNFKRDFKNYYNIGIEMANSYIKYGPSEGNKMMLKLDPFAEKLTKGLETWIKEHRDENNLKTKEIEENIHSIKLGVLIVGALIMLFSGLILLIISSKIINEANRFQNGLSEFFKYINREIEQITPLDDTSEDEFGTMAKAINQNIEKTKTTLQKDKELIDEAKNVMNRVKKGWYSEYIKSTTTNIALEEFKNDFNDMVKETKKHFENMNTVLNQYTKLDYRNELKLDHIEKGGVFEILINNVNDLRESITLSLVENKKTGLVLQSSANTLLNNVNTLNTNSTQAAASLEETAAALEEITSNVSNTTSNIIQMSKYASSLTKSSNHGQKLANQTTKAMDEIDTEVSAINEAITVIDQISFQTNILSLNAAVEAATAGEAGKGFAVVAQEVRNLATRSAEAANEIKTLVENATNKANNGKQISNDMIEGYNQLNENISKTIKLISDVETTSKEQQIGITQINDVINSLDKQTQENANIASATQKVANDTSSISNKIIEDANAKEFNGKNDIK